MNTQQADFDFSSEEFKDWVELLTMIEETGGQVPCTNYPDAYFPDKDGMDGNAYEVALAKQMCQECPVVRDCLLFAMKHRQAGIWGGMAERERDRFRMRMQVR